VAGLKAREFANQAAPEQINRVLELIESIGTESANGGVLVQTSETTSEDAVISIPNGLSGFPWSGLSVSMEFGTDLSFSFADGNGRETILCGRKYSFLPIPRERTRTGKLRNIFDPSRYLKLQPELEGALADICPDCPRETLSALVCNGRIEFEPIDQLRIGTSAAWVQTPEWQTCDQCKKRLVLILQLPGSSTGRKELREGTIYLFGCVAHLKDTKQVVQFS